MCALNLKGRVSRCRQHRSCRTAFALFLHSRPATRCLCDRPLRLAHKSNAVRDAEMMLRRSFATLRSSQTHANLKAAFAGESQANRRYLYFAQKADVEGQPDVAAVFRSTAEGETGHAFGHLEFLAEAGDPATGEPIGNR